MGGFSAHSLIVNELRCALAARLCDLCALIDC